MRYSLFLLLSLFILPLSGCTQTTSITTSTTGITLSKPTSLNPNLSEQDLSNVSFMRGNILSGIYFYGNRYAIIISGHTLAYEGFFSIEIPQELIRWENTSQYGDDIFLANNDVTKYLTLQTRRWYDTSVSEKQLCNKDLAKGVILKSKKTKIVQGRNIYITNVVFQSSGPDKIPYQLDATQFCFVEGDQIYNFAISNYSRDYMESIIDSLHFTVNTSSEGMNIATGLEVSTPTIPAQESILDPISRGSIGSGTIISGSNYSILLSGNTMTYSGVFIINMPKYLEKRESTSMGQFWFSLTNTTKDRFLTFTIADAGGWRKELNDKDKCIFEKYQEGVSSQKTIMKKIQGKPVYITNLVFYVMAAPEIDIPEKKWEQADICFVKNGNIYTISISNYDSAYLQSIVDSFHFY